MLERSWQDLIHSCRALRQRPLFALVVIGSLGVGIGANAAIFDTASRILGGALPIEEPGRVVALYTTHPDLGEGTPLSFLNWRDLRDQTETLGAVAGYQWTGLAVTTGEATTRVPSQIVTGNYFDVLGVRARFGRTFSDPADSIPSPELEVVVSHRFWRDVLGGSVDRIGETLRINGQPFTIVGVVGPEFRGIDVGMRVDLWVPFGVYRRIYPEPDWVWFENRRGELLYGLARLAPGVDLAEARAELTGIARRLESAHPDDNERRGIRALPVAEATIFPWARPFIRSGLLLLAGAAGLTLLITAVNVANLLLARGHERRHEIAIRRALGISRAGLASRVLVESLVLSVLAGVAGIWFIMLTHGALQRTAALIPSPTPSALDPDLGLDPRVLAVTAGLSLVVGLLLGVVPTIQALRGGSGELLRARVPVSGRSRRWDVRSTLLSLQLALSLVALLGGGLFLRSLAHARTLDPGFEPSRLAFVRVDLALAASADAAADARRRIAAALTGVAGVENIGVSPRRPMDGGWKRPVAPAELAGDPSRQRFPYTDAVDGGFFEAMGLAIIEGRTFSPEEQLDSAPVAVVNELAAERWWPGQSAVGQSLVLFDEQDRTELEVIGIVETSSYRRVTETAEEYVYMPLELDFAGPLTFAIGTSVEPTPLMGSIQEAIRAVDRTLPIVEVRTAAAVLEQSMWAHRLSAGFLGIFAGLALVLSAVGIYGVIAFDVSRRTREFGLRVAVGAQRNDIRRLVLAHSGKHYLFGTLLGIPLAYGLSRWVSGLIAVDRLDPYAVAGSFLALLLVGLIASLAPARRATRVDPTQVLRA